MVIMNKQSANEKIKEKKSNFFSLTENPLIIPSGVHKKPIQCPHCESFFVENNRCEDCGKQAQFSLLGEPLGPKSFYALKERYLDSLVGIVQLFNSLESKQSKEALNYKRQLYKRCELLMMEFRDQQIQGEKNKRLFYLELKNVIEELVCFEHSVEDLDLKIVNTLSETNPNMAQELVYHLYDAFRSYEMREKNIVQRYFGSNRLFQFFVIFSLTAISLSLAYAFIFL